MLSVLLQSAAPADLLVSVLRTLLALIGVCALAWVILRALSRRGFGRFEGKGRLQVVERLSLGPKRQLYLVRAGQRVLLLGAAESGPLTLLAELDAELADAEVERPSGREGTS